VFSVFTVPPSSPVHFGRFLLNFAEFFKNRRDDEVRFSLLHRIFEHWVGDRSAPKIDWFCMRRILLLFYAIPRNWIPGSQTLCYSTAYLPEPRLKLCCSAIWNPKQDHRGQYSDSTFTTDERRTLRHLGLASTVCSRQGKLHPSAILIPSRHKLRV
jgi:hypothetical protein